ncbi:TIGR04219 family outer membrane beta-barrel protein [Acinetobacter sp. ANC 4173]|uniref:TIGR04219 family outer membrane beta-barrel protein n=1 Tax=Acinetobacter sp. ANC 4173 TaxID=2529837 RepID=UPI00103EF489|nr:TIGR04219 family outer membrane beta-barrel protein [Acinetobacter sp. ANC 4173]TCB80503.1 TIGR04219 family outer membrane beta-barrel protein [Acinetobacter sp. ANC 4173]
MRVAQAGLVALGVGLSGLAQADLVALKGDISYWAYNGHAEMNNTAPFSKEKLDNDGAVQFSVALEHPVPIIPNAKIRYVNLDSQTESSVAGQPNYAVNLDHADFILYYEILDNVVDLDIGAGATTLNGDITNFAGQRTNIDETYPIIYGTVGGKLPFTGLSAKAELTYSNFNDVQLTDALAEIQYNFIDNMLVDVGVKAGYRIFTVDLDDYNRNDIKLEFKGPYIGLDAHF